MKLPPLIHYSDEPLGKINSDYQSKTPHMKPNGFWVSCEDGDGWKDWCESEGFALTRFAHEALIKLVPDANILHLKTGEDIDNFTDNYLSSPPELKNYPTLETININWARVAEQYQGIMIAPYQWSRRMAQGCVWYYGWDCSSGCIWDAKAIEA